jgi:S1-C subfamily serine protease
VSRLGLLLCCLACASAPPATSRAASLPELIEVVRPAIVGVGTHDPLGAPRYQLGATGFVVGDGLTVVTNSHVVAVLDEAGGKKLGLVVFVGRGRSPSVRKASVSRRDPEHDLAVLRIDGPPVPALRLAPAAPVREGTGVIFSGFPIGNVLGLYPVTHRGIVSAVVPIAIPQVTARGLTATQIRRLQEPYEVYQLDATAYPGNSGSPVIDDQTGLVIGVVNSVLVKESREAVLKDPSAITYAIPVSFLRPLLGP